MKHPMPKSIQIALLTFYLIILVSVSYSQCPQSHTTPIIAGNGNPGIMFDVEATNDIIITTIKCFISNNPHDIEIYYKQGTHAGYDNAPSAWTFAGSVSGLNINWSIPVEIPIQLNLPVLAGEAYAFYVTVTNNQHAWTLYTIGNDTFQDNNTIIRPGTGKGYPFGSYRHPRQFNGAVNYIADCDSVLRIGQYLQEIEINEGWNMVSSYLRIRS
jgi:hypothetical protein